MGHDHAAVGNCLEPTLLHTPTPPRSEQSTVAAGQASESAAGGGPTPCGRGDIYPLSPGWLLFAEPATCRWPSLRVEQSVPAEFVSLNPEAPVLCVLPDHSTRLRLQFQSPFRGPEPWLLPAFVGKPWATWCGIITHTLLWLVPFIGAWGLPPPVVEQCIPALVVYLYPVVFAISQAAPTPAPVPNPYNAQGGIARPATPTCAYTYPYLQPPGCKSAPGEGVPRVVRTRGPSREKQPPAARQGSPPCLDLLLLLPAHHLQVPPPRQRASQTTAAPQTTAAGVMVRAGAAAVGPRGPRAYRNQIQLHLAAAAGAGAATGRMWCTRSAVSSGRSRVRSKQARNTRMGE